MTQYDSFSLRAGRCLLIWTYLKSHMDHIWEGVNIDLPFPQVSHWPSACVSVGEWQFLPCPFLCPDLLSLGHQPIHHPSLQTEPVQQHWEHLCSSESDHHCVTFQLSPCDQCFCVCVLLNSPPPPHLSEMQKQEEETFSSRLNSARSSHHWTNNLWVEATLSGVTRWCFGLH